MPGRQAPQEESSESIRKNLAAHVVVPPRRGWGSACLIDALDVEPTLRSKFDALQHIASTRPSTLVVDAVGEPTVVAQRLRTALVTGDSPGTERRSRVVSAPCGSSWR